MQPHDTFYIGKLKGVGKVWQVTACDVASSYSVARILPELTAAAVATFLRTMVVPAVRQAGWSVERVLTDGGGEFSRQKTSPAMVEPSCLSLRSLDAGPGDRGYLVRARGNSAGRELAPGGGARDTRVLTKLRKSLSGTATYMMDLGPAHMAPPADGCHCFRRAVPG
jgi:hypothetical protein